MNSSINFGPIAEDSYLLGVFELSIMELKSICENGSYSYMMFHHGKIFQNSHYFRRSSQTRDNPLIVFCHGYFGLGCIEAFLLELKYR